MHEFAIIQSVLKQLEEIAKENHLQSISQVTLQIGKLRQIVPEFLQFAFETAAENSLAKNAKLIIEEVPIKMRCKSCNKEFTVKHHTYICPKCHAASLEILCGKEILIKNIVQSRIISLIN